ncbi:MAG: hypothetical protein J6V28_00535 [Tidjanibacter sp.]|nr:hypothetical protein [Tidjanibacter sp.]
MLFHLPTDNEEFIKALNSFINIPPRKVERDYSGDKIITEGKYGGIWIKDRQEYAKFVSAVKTFPFEEDGEGIVFTDNYFYAYYRNIEGQATPFVSVYMNKYESQDVVNQVNQELKNVRTGERIKKYIDTAISRAWRKQSQNNDNNGDNSGTSTRRRDGVLGVNLLRKGRYAYTPEIYQKVKSTDSGTELDYRHSLRQPTAEEMADFRARKRTLEEVDIPEFDESPKLSLRDPIERLREENGVVAKSFKVVKSFDSPDQAYSFNLWEHKNFRFDFSKSRYYLCNTKQTRSITTKTIQLWQPDFSNATTVVMLSSKPLTAA